MSAELGESTTTRRCGPVHIRGPVGQTATSCPEPGGRRSPMSTGVHGPTRASIEEKTLRTDNWWVQPLITFVVFSAFVVYATIRAFMGSHYFVEPYLSPFYSPCLGDC